MILQNWKAIGLVSLLVILFVAIISLWDSWLAFLRGDLT